MGAGGESLDAAKPAVQELPASLTWMQISAACMDGRKLMVINGEVRNSAPRCADAVLRCQLRFCNAAAAQVYDVAGWVQKHPGGKVLLTYVGEDATDSVRAFHRDEEQMKKYLSSLRIASLAPETPLVVCPPCATRFSFTR